MSTIFTTILFKVLGYSLYFPMYCITSTNVSLRNSFTVYLTLDLVPVLPRSVSLFTISSGILTLFKLRKPITSLPVTPNLYNSLPFCPRTTSVSLRPWSQYVSKSQVHLIASKIRCSFPLVTNLNLSPTIPLYWVKREVIL